jgi:sulfate adenylyltransferase subunit 2
MRFTRFLGGTQEEDVAPVLEALEAEGIWVLREVAGAFAHSVLLYSIGKDSSVLLRLARMAFRPGSLSFPLLHVDTTWKFREMIEFRDLTVREHDLELIVARNEAALAEGVNPFTHGTQKYTRIMKTVALRQALDMHGFDVALGGSRRDEEFSRAKERVFTVRKLGHRWEPRKQRPELWRTPNTLVTQQQTMRVFPMSNWDKRKVSRDIQAKEIPVVSHYFAKPRPLCCAATRGSLSTARGYNSCPASSPSYALSGSARSAVIP